jgi:hypothetical protein
MSRDSYAKIMSWPAATRALSFTPVRESAATSAITSRSLTRDTDDANHRAVRGVHRRTRRQLLEMFAPIPMVDQILKCDALRRATTYWRDSKLREFAPESQRGFSTCLP